MSKLYNKIHDPSNIIHHTAILGKDVTMGKNNYIGPYCVIYDNVDIGNNNRFESHCCVGSEPEHKEYFGGKSQMDTFIGDNNVFREFITINQGTVRNTTVGNNVVMLRNSHIGHDTIVENNVTLSCNSIIGGHSHVMEGANMALGSICHQYSVIGAYSIIGMGGIVTKKSKIIPGKKYVGNPVRDIGSNNIGLQRNNISPEDLDYLYHKHYELTQKYE